MLSKLRAESYAKMRFQVVFFLQQIFSVTEPLLLEVTEFKGKNWMSYYPQK